MEITTVLLAIFVVILLGSLIFLGFRKLGNMDSSAKLPKPAIDSLALDDDDVLQQLVAQGRTIEAIKLVRRNTSMGLREAKAYVESLTTLSSPAAPDMQHTPLEADSNVEQEVRHLLSQRQKIEAIKLVREATGWGLREAKDYVEALERLP